MTDIFNEVDEEVRRERLRQMWERWGHLIVLAAVLIVVGVAGWRGYSWWQARLAAEAGAAFEAALTLSEQDKHAEAQTAFAKIAADAPWGYRLLARFREAAEVAHSDPAAAVKAYDSLAADSSLDRSLQDLANVRAAMILVDTAPYDQVRTRLEPLSAADRPYRHTARELMALSAWRSNDMAAVRKWSEVISADAETPASTRVRMQVLMALVGSGTKS